MRCPQRILRKAEGRHENLTQSLAYPLFDRRGACGGHVTAQPTTPLTWSPAMQPCTTFPGSLKSTEKLSACNTCTKLTSPILGCYMGGKLVCRSCTNKALRPTKHHA